MRTSAPTTRRGFGTDITNRSGYRSFNPTKSARQSGAAVTRAVPQAHSTLSDLGLLPHACSYQPVPHQAPRLGGQAIPRPPVLGTLPQASVARSDDLERDAGTSAAVARSSAPSGAGTRSDAPDHEACPSAATVVRSLPDSRSWCDSENLQSVSEYAPQIFQLLLKEEPKYLPRHNYMDLQKDLNAKMRAILMDWLVEVHMKYKLRPETLHLTVSIIDLYLTRIPVPRKRLQLVGVVAMFIAAKFEEIKPPEVGDYEYITDNAYTKKDILVMECQMLTTLNFQIAIPTVAHFMDPLQRMNGCDEAHKEFVSYLCELALLEIRMIKYTPSHLVSAVMLLSNELMGRKSPWPLLLQESTQHMEEDLRPCVREVRDLLDQAPSHWLQAVVTKYQRPQHHSVACRWP